MMDEALREFLIESTENLHQMELDLVLLETDPTNAETLGSIFRTIHTIKGTCGFLGFPKLEAVTHAGESLLSKMRDGTVRIDAEIASALLALVDAARSMLTSIEATGGDGDADYSELIASLARLQSKATQEPGGDGGPKAAAGAPEIADPPADAADPARLAGGKAATAARSTVRVDVHLLDRLMDIVGELVLARNQIVQLSAVRDDSLLGGAAQRLDHITSELQESVMKTRMQPIERLFRNFPRLVRDLATSCGKPVGIVMEGADTELDKSVIEAIKDPLTHLVRNAVDHGVEDEAARVTAGKPLEGRIALRAFHESGQVIIEVADDGGGIDAEQIRARAIDLGFVTAEQAARMSPREALNLVFLPGLSTARRVTNVSGRGVGLDVVSANVERIGGSVDVQSSPEGTSFTIRIPLTLAIVPALIVRSCDERFAIPQASLLELVRLDPDRPSGGIEMMHGAPVFRLRERLLPIVFLASELRLEASTPRRGSQFVVVLSADGRQFGLVVDAVEDTQEIVVKPVGQFLRRIPVLAGATVLGNGRVALILDVLGLAMRAHVVKAGRDRVVAESPQPVEDAVEERQKLLLFRSRDDGRMAIPLDRVARLEEFPRTAVERAGDFDVVQYRGTILPLFYVNALLPERRKRPRADETAVADERMHVVVYADQGRDLGLVVDGILDIVEESVAPQRPGSRKGVLGTIIIRDRVTELLDVDGIVRGLDPTFFSLASEVVEVG